jgi:23S rRNA (cytosine1962-C5)-methyltransferase
LNHDFFFADKPAGCTTHTSFGGSSSTPTKKLIAIDPNDGFKEMLEARLGFELFTAHRLDRETSGAMIFARTAAAAETLRAAFAEHQIQKRYLLLTDRKISTKAFTRESRIEREGKSYVSHSEGAANARTHFRLLEEAHGFFLWEAKPETGRSHQIRLHAEDAGMPILGDTIHSGSPFPALCLHSAELKYGGLTHTAAPPRWLAKLELCRDLLLIRWFGAVERRERLLRSWGGDRPETLRWIHSEGDPLRAEQLGSVYSLSWFEDTLPSERERRTLGTLVQELGWKDWTLQLRGNRGRSPNEAQSLHSSGFDARAPRWIASENGMKFEFRTDSGLSPGLFLDQRRNREWVRDHSRGARVLNLFCYTSGFSVAAALGGASKVVSVDVSKTFLDWSRENFLINGIPTEGHEFRFIDSREYLIWAKKKGLEFDLVICDPPSFGRSKAGVFKIEKDFDELIALVLAVTSPRGRVLFSLNFEVWSEADFADRLAKALKPFPTRRLERTPSADWDFEFPHEPRNMKSFFIVSN